MSDVLFHRRAEIYYVGSFDDEVLRHNDAGFNLDSINDTLSQAALFGGKLLINDGSLMLSAAGRRALLSRDASPLLDLLDTGYVKLFSRNKGNLAALPREMEDTVPTYAELLRHSGWPRLRDQLQEIQDEIDPQKSIEAWPTCNLGVGFQKLLNAALIKLEAGVVHAELTAEQVERVRKDFNSAMTSDPKKPARTVWRQICAQRDIQLTREAESHLHWVGLEAYHYNLAMTSSQRYPDRRSGVITRYSYLFDTVRHSRSRLRRGASLDEMPTPGLPLLMDRRVLHGGALLRSVATVGTALHQRKIEYLAAVDAALLDSEGLPEVTRAAEAYSKELARFIRNQERERSQPLLTAIKLVTGAAATAHLAHVAGADGFGVQLVGTAATQALQFGSAWIAKRFLTNSGLFTMPIAVDLLDPLEDYADQVPAFRSEAQGSQWFAFVGLREDAVKAHVDQLPQF